MASSTDLPFLVCTNTWRDYAVTVRGGDIEPLVERLVVDRLLPAFGSVVASANPPFGTAVGVADVPGCPDRVLAFRVFDAGVYQGRAHTIGLVAVVVPRQGRSWSLSALLAALPAPTPDSEHYELPAQLADRHPQPAEPFASLDAWDRSGAPPPSDRVLCFCTPAKLGSPEIDWTVEPLQPVSKMPRSGRYAVILVALAVVVVSGFAAWRSWQPTSTSQPRHDTTPDDSVLDDGRMRDLLISGLVGLDFLDQTQAQTLSKDKLKRWVLAADIYAREDLGKLYNQLSDLRDSASFESKKTMIKHWLRERQPSKVASDMLSEVPTDQVTKEALKFLTEVYKPLIEDSKSLKKRLDDESGYKRLLKDLKEALGEQP